MVHSIEKFQYHSDMLPEVKRKPDWLKIRLNTSGGFRYLKNLMREERLNTVCEEARCPNIHECWGQHRTATFMVLGDTCTRRCRFCAVKTGLPGAVDYSEPQRVAESVAKMGLRHVVITMVNRDDLEDGGAAVIAATVRAIHREAGDLSVEVLTSDFLGACDAIDTVLDAEPEIMSHNIETVRRLTRQVRSRSDYDRSLDVLRYSGEVAPDIPRKSSIMLGLGETTAEIEETMDDLLSVGVSLLNIGQYLQPSRTHLPVQRYWNPDEFEALRDTAVERGFKHCDAGPLVRSSYHAGEGYEEYRRSVHPLYRGG